MKILNWPIKLCVLLVFIAIFFADETTADHHKNLQPVAKPGQVIATYRGDCPSEAVDGVIEQIKTIISYERKNSPVLYSSSPGIWADGKVGAVDLHDSKESMEEAFAWQASDETWSSSYAKIAASCETTVEEFEVVMLIAR